MKKLTAWLITLAMVCGTFSACNTDSVPEENLTETDSDMTETSETSGDAEDLPSPEDDPLGLFARTYGEEDFLEFKAALDELKRLAIEGKDEAATIEALDRADSLLRFCVSQMEIANIVYFKTMSDEDNEVYSRMNEYHANALSMIADVKREIYLAGSPFCDVILHDYTEAELEALAVSDPALILECTQTLNRITEEFYNLDPNVENWEAIVTELYAEYINSSNTLAKQYGYDDYYEYSAVEKWFRDYDIDKAAFREYVAKYLVPICVQLDEQFIDYLETHETADYLVWKKLVEESDVAEVESFIGRFIETFDGTVKEKMNALFDGKHIIYGDENSFPAACTLDLANFDEAVCYFATGYYGSVATVAHEMGHYVSLYCYDGFTETLDFLEVHSQATEALLLGYLKNEVSPTVCKMYLYDWLLTKVKTVIRATIVDEFEEIAYSTEGTITVGEIDAIIAELDKKYGTDTLKAFEMGEYIKWVGIQSPIYYFSYASSGMSALELYSILLESGSETAYEIYEKLQEGPADVTFDENLEYAGLNSAYDEELFRKTTEIIMNELQSAE